MTERNGHPGPPGVPTVHPAFSLNSDIETSANDPADAVVQLLAAAIASRFTTSNTSQDRGPQPMLTVTQTAALLGVSRMTVTRMADAGDLPCVIVTRGKQKKIRRFPRQFIEELTLGKESLASAADTTSRWMARPLEAHQPPRRSTK